MQSDAASTTRTGILAALSAYSIWGFSPIYFRAVGHLPLLEILAHRIVWSLILVALLIGVGRHWRDLTLALASRQNLRRFLATTLLVSCNWLVFIWAISQGRLLEVSLGYYINPLVSVLLGLFLLGERLSRLQFAAVALAAFGVLNLTVSYGALPWVALALALTFGFYGLLRKTAKADALVGLTIETGLMAPIAVAYLGYLYLQGAGAFARIDAGTDLLLLASGPVTALPLLLFAMGARRLPLATVGLLQYLAPTLHFILAVTLFGEPFGRAHVITFACIWTALALYSAESMRLTRGFAGKSG